MTKNVYLLDKDV